MKPRLFAVLAIATFGGFFASSAQSALAKKTCNTTYTNTTVSGGLVVPEGDSCTLENDTISGGLEVRGGTIQAQHNNISGGFLINNGFGGFHNGFEGDECENNIRGGLVIENVSNGSTFSFGEADQGCPGGNIEGGARILNNPLGGTLELDGGHISGGLIDTNNTTLALDELEGLTVTGGAKCADNSGAGAVNDGDGGNSTYSGGNQGCPVS